MTDEQADEVNVMEAAAGSAPFRQDGRPMFSGRSMGGMTLVRLRQGAHQSAQGPAANGVYRTHIITSERAKLEPLTACCGLVFEPSTVEEVPWGTEWPHQACLRKSGQPWSSVERVYREARNQTMREKAGPGEFETAIAVMEELFAARGRDWVQDDGGAVWTYEPSFSGVFRGDRRYPRARDLGLEPLRVEIPYPGTVNIHTCGVRDGCCWHLACTETLVMNDLETIEQRVIAHEVAATSIPLHELAWCLVTGDCSAIAVYDTNDPVSAPSGAG